MTAILFPLARPFAGVFVFTTALFVFVSGADAQASRSISTTGRRMDDFNRQSERALRDELTREMGGRKPTEEERRQAVAKKAQIKEDFESLQMLYNDIVTRLQAKEQMSNTYVGQVTEKISKSGARLRNNIEFPVQKVEEEKRADSVVKPTSLKELCFEIHAFLTNPVFETGVLDLIYAEKARDTLDKIIRGSENVRQQLAKID